MIFVKNNIKKIRVSNAIVQKKLKKILHSLGYDDFDVSVWFTTNTTIRRYNKKFRKKDAATDILSFPYHSELKPGKEIIYEPKPWRRIIVKNEEDKNLGDIMISLEFAKKNATEWGVSFPKCIDILLVHGIVHLLGYDHKTEKDHKIMHAYEQELLHVVS